MKRLEHIRRQFYDIQERRCPVCDTEIEYGAAWCYDKPSKLVLCRRCFLLLIPMRRYKGPVLDRAIKLVLENKL